MISKCLTHMIIFEMFMNTMYAQRQGVLHMISVVLSIPNVIYI